MCRTFKRCSTRRCRSSASSSIRSCSMRSIPTDADRKSTRLNSSHLVISYAVFCLKKKKDTDCNETVHTIEFGQLPLLEFRHIDVAPYAKPPASYGMIHSLALSLLPFCRPPPTWRV